MIFAALILLAFLAVALVCVDRWQETEQTILRVREEFKREPAPWWWPRD